MQYIVGIRLKKSGKLVVCRTNRDQNRITRDRNGSGQKRIEQIHNMERFEIHLKFLVVSYSIDVLGIVVVANTHSRGRVLY